MSPYFLHSVIGHLESISVGVSYLQHIILSGTCLFIYYHDIKNNHVLCDPFYINPSDAVSALYI